jgi:hypothetical protein
MTRPASVLLALLAPAAVAAAPSFDAAAIRADLVAVADTSLGGREIGSPGNERAATFIAEAFLAAGLSPAAAEAGGRGGRSADAFLREFSVGGTPMRNVVGLVRGGKRPGQALVIGAHYDGLARDAAGQALAGVDDNASGVAVLLALARGAASLVAEGRAPKRSLVFVAFSGEEQGLLGSSQYVRDPAVPLDSTIAMINLDTIGRLREDRLYVFGVGSAAEFGSMLDGMNYGAGFVLEKIAEDSGSSDQIPFSAQRIPALHFFTGPHDDYHRAGDTVEKANVAGMARIAEFAWEAATYLAKRDSPLTFQFVGTKKPAAGGPERRASLGTVPDFAYSGMGVRVSGVTPGSPADLAGMAAGDIVVELDGQAVNDLADLSAILKSHQPGDYVSIVFRRDTGERRVGVTLVERR